MQYLLVGLEGILTFLSPCILPMLPIYIAYFAGDTSTRNDNNKQTLTNALLFVSGFMLIFVSFGLFITSLGRIFIQYREVIHWVSGILLIFLGIDFLRGSPLMGRYQPTMMSNKDNNHDVGAFLLGITFAISWTPCVGTFLAGVLAMVIQSRSYLVAGSLLVTYTLGLGIPFVLVALLIDELGTVLQFLKNHLAIIQAISGLILIIMGVFTITGHMEQWLLWLS